MGIKHLITCVVAGIDYLVHPQILGSVEENLKADQIIPVLVLSESEINAGPEELGRTLQYFVDHDDVCSDDFTGILVMKPSTTGHDVAPESLAALRATFSSIYHLAGSLETFANDDSLPSGPYFLSGSNLHEAWRLYPDDLDAFTFGMIPAIIGEQEFEAVAPQASGRISKAIPVPSRLYHKPTIEKPLAGTRVSLIDAFHIENTKTTLSSRAWSELYSASNTTAAYAKKLIDLGAVIVGKTKTSQFLTGAEWIDVQPPINPRADGYQKAFGSSTGAVASLSGYDWLDNSIGVDSALLPPDDELRHGLYSIQPTLGSASTDGAITGSPRDTVKLFGRSLDDLDMIAKESLDAPSDQTKHPKQILYPVDFFPLADHAQQQLIEDFIAVLEASWRAKKTKINVTRIWEKKAPTKAKGQTLQQYMAKAPDWSLSYENYHAYDNFRSKYQDQFDKEPFVESTPRTIWDIGVNVTKAEYENYLHEINVFQTWFDKNIMPLGSDKSSGAVMILPTGTVRPTYRDDFPGDLYPMEGIVPNHLYAMLGAPHIFVPFSQVPYESRINKRTEYLPVSASVMGARGADLTLIRSVKEAFQKAGWPTHVDTGRYTFPLDQNPLTDGSVETSQKAL